jgi:hypothetical protein
LNVPYRIVFLLIPLVVAIGWLIWSLIRPQTFNSVPRVVKYVVLGILTVLLIQQSYLEYRWISVEREVTRAIEPISGPGFTVHCQRLTEAMLYISSDRGRVEQRQDGSAEPRAMLTWQTCQDIKGWLASDRTSPTLDQITALHIATHEAMHLRGEFNEAAAECDAVQFDPWIFERLGATADLADRMAERYKTEIYPRLADEYVNGGCQAGGALDLFPDDDQWPRTTNEPTTHS